MRGEGRANREPRLATGMRPSAPASCSRVPLDDTVAVSEIMSTIVPRRDTGARQAMHNKLFAHEKERAAKKPPAQVSGLPEISRDAIPRLGGRESSVLAIGPGRDMHPARQPPAEPEAGAQAKDPSGGLY